jgi:iron complex outermembrane receptor protein
MNINYHLFSALSFFILFLLLTLLHTNRAFAQDKPAELLQIEDFFKASLEELMNVGMVSASQKKQGVLEAPANAYVITEQQIRERGYRNLLDLLEDIPEVDVQRNVNPDTRNIVSIRGIAGNEKLLILLDGFRITPATGDSYTIGHNFALADAQRVEIVIGPASALYGVDAFSGVVNIITATERGAQFKSGGRVSSMFGSFNTTDNQLFLRMKADKLRISLAASGYFSKEPNYAQAYPKEYGWYNHALKDKGFISISPQINQLYRYPPFGKQPDFTGDSLTGTFQMPTHTRYIHPQINFGDFTAGFVHHYERHSSAYGFQPRYTAYESDAFIARSSQTMYFRHDFTSFNQKWQLSSQLSYNFYQISPQSNFFGAISRWQRGYPYANGQSVRLQEQFSYTASNKLSIVAGFMLESILAVPRTPPLPKPLDPSLPFQDQDLYLIGSKVFEPFFLPAGIRDLAKVAQTPVIPFYLNYQNYGGYAQAQYQPVKWVNLTLGTRYDYNTRFGGSINPRVGAVLTPHKKLNIKLLYGTSFLAPSPEKAFRQDGYLSQILYYSPNFSRPSGGMLLILDNARLPNRDLQPEKLQALEGSINVLITNNLSFNIGVAHTQVNNLINQFANADSLRLYEPTAFWRRYQDPRLDAEIYRLETSRNEGNLKTTTITAQANFRIPLGKWHLDGFVGYSYVGGQFVRPKFTGSSYFALFGSNIRNGFSNDDLLDLYTDTIPAQSGGVILHSPHSLKSVLTLAQERFSLTTRLLVAGNARSVGTNWWGYGEYQNPLYMRLNVTARYNLKTKKKYNFSVFATAENLLDNRYYHTSFGRDDIMPLIPQDPRRVLGGLEVSF